LVGRVMTGPRSNAEEQRRGAAPFWPGSGGATLQKPTFLLSTPLSLPQECCDAKAAKQLKDESCNIDVNTDCSKVGPLGLLGSCCACFAFKADQPCNPRISSPLQLCLTRRACTSHCQRWTVIMGQRHCRV
jgi:hypothetical protein